jgi:hypothetical protein
MNSQTNLKKALGLALAITACSTFGACKSGPEKVAEERQEATKEIGKAQQEVAREQAEGAKEAGRARASGDAEEYAEERVEATKEIADAERKVDDEKVEATKEITDAKVDAGQSTGTYEKR